MKQTINAACWATIVALLLGEFPEKVQAVSFHGSQAVVNRLRTPLDGAHKRRRMHQIRKRSFVKCAASGDSKMAATKSASPLKNNNLASASGSSAAPSTSSKGNATVLASKSDSSKQIAQWDWSDSKNVMYGVNLGGWLMLEKWMATPLFDKFAPNAVDDYTFAQTLGSKTADVLKQNHWDSWVTEADVDLMHKAGVTHIRIPVGYWAFINNVQNDPFPALSGQQAQVDRVLGYAVARNMHLILDLHSAPGRASIDQCNGRLNGPVNFYDADMQQNNDATIHAMYKYAANSPHKKNIAAIALVNEPDACMSNFNQTRITALQSFYQRSYDWMAKQSWRMPIIIHHGYCGLDQWKSFVSDKEPKYLVMEDHPYPGTFVATDSQESALGSVCYSANLYSNYPVPVAVTEWTLNFRVPGADDGFVKQMAQQQLSAWSNSAGSTFWSHRLPGVASGWDWSAMFNQKMIGQPAKNQSIKDWASSMQSSCGKLQTPSWKR